MIFRNILWHITTGDVFLVLLGLTELVSYLMVITFFVTLNKKGRIFHGITLFSLLLVNSVNSWYAFNEQVSYGQHRFYYLSGEFFMRMLVANCGIIFALVLLKATKRYWVKFQKERLKE